MNLTLQQPMGTLSANMKPLKASAQSLRETTLALDTADTQALYDQLTQLPNRRLFIDRFNQTYLSSRRSITFTALLFLDLDKFKVVNDVYGHAVGDLLLIEVAKRIKAAVRDDDTVARLGGGEFGVLLANQGADEQRAIIEAEKISEEIRASIAMPVIIKQDGLDVAIDPQCTVSIGFSVFLFELGDRRAILEKLATLSNMAMIQAKKAGGNRIQIS